jgi:hypothetical protein
MYKYTGSFSGSSGRLLIKQRQYHDSEGASKPSSFTVPPLFQQTEKHRSAGESHDDNVHKDTSKIK